MQDRSTPNLERRTQTKPVVLIGDSMIKHIEPKKLSRKPVNKHTYPGKTPVEIAQAIEHINVPNEPSHVIIHAGTNDLPLQSEETCTQNIIHLVQTAKQKFPRAKIAVSGVINRDDIDVQTKVNAVNTDLKNNSQLLNYVFIDNSKIDTESCLNGSKLHLNIKGSAVLASTFIRFIRPRPKTNKQGFQKDSIQAVRCGHNQ